MRKFEIANRNTGQTLGVFEGETPEAALLKAVDVLGDWEVSIFDNQSAHPSMRHFDSVREALKVFVPEAIVHISDIT